MNNISEARIKKYKISYLDTFVEAGSGSLPTEKIPSLAIVINNVKHISNLHNKFHQCKIPLIGYIKNDVFHIDLKAVPNEQTKSLINTLNEVLK